MAQILNQSPKHSSTDQKQENPGEHHKRNASELLYIIALHKNHMHKRDSMLFSVGIQIPEHNIQP